LSEGELGLDTTNNRFKIGDGVNTWDNIEFSQYTNKAETFSDSVTIATTDWTGSVAPFIVTKTVTGILQTDTPFVDLDLSAAPIGDVEDIQQAWTFVYRVEASATNELKFYATDEPTEDLVVQIKVVR
jgi:hypothetical protein